MYIPGSNKAKCNHCGNTLSTVNITGVKEHLQNIKVCCYLISPQAAANEDKGVRRLLEQRKQSNTLLSSTATGSSAGSARHFYSDRISAADQQHMISLLEDVIIMTNLPHSWVENPVVEAFFKALRPAFTLPSRYQVRRSLLDGVLMCACSLFNSLCSFLCFRSADPCLMTRSTGLSVMFAPLYSQLSSWLSRLMAGRRRWAQSIY